MHPAMKTPAVSYTTTPDGTRIAYSVFGEGPPLVHMPDIPVGMNWQWEIPEIRSWYEHLASVRQVVTFDPAGVGLSDREAKDVSFAPGGHALEAVVAATGISEFALLAAYRRTPHAITYAAENAVRVRQLLLWCPYTVGKVVQGSRGHQALINLFASDWQTFTEYVLRISTGLPGDRVVAIATMARDSISRKTYRDQAVTQLDIDASDHLGAIVVPTLVLHRQHLSMVPLESGREIAAGIAGAELAVFNGEAMYPYFGEQDEILDAILSFLGRPVLARQTRARAGTVPLSTREVEVLSLVAEGMSNQQIAAALTLSVHTVGHHLSSILQKTGSRNRSEATAYAVRMGLNPSPRST